jgi:hypothetical protein
MQRDAPLIGIRTRTSARAIASAVNPCPSVPRSTAIRPLAAAVPANAPMSIASSSGVVAAITQPLARSWSSASGHGAAAANGTTSAAPDDVRIALR